jgi:hypothetical protein
MIFFIQGLAQREQVKVAAPAGAKIEEKLGSAFKRADTGLTITFAATLAV